MPAAGGTCLSRAQSVSAPQRQQSGEGRHPLLFNCDQALVHNSPRAATLLAQRSSCRSARRSTRNTRRSTAFGTGGSTCPSETSQRAGAARRHHHLGQRGRPRCVDREAIGSPRSASDRLRVRHRRGARAAPGLRPPLAADRGAPALPPAVARPLPRVAAPHRRLFGTHVSRRARSHRVCILPRDATDGIHLVPALSQMEM